MALAKPFIDPRYFAPILKEYLAKGAYAGGGGGGGGLSHLSGAGRGQIDPAAALTLWRMLGGEGPQAAYAAAPAPASVPTGDSSFMEYGGSPIYNAELADADNFFWLGA